jgi:hypothetical protein
MAMSIGASAQNASNFTESLTTGSATTQASGSTFVIYVFGNGVLADITGISDSKGNTYPAAGSPNATFTWNSGSQSAYAWVSTGASTGGSGHTFTVTTNTFLSLVIFAVEIISGSTYALLDQSAVTPSLSNVTTANTPSVTPTVNGEVVLGLFGASYSATTTITDTTGFNNILQSYLTGGASSIGIVGAISGTVQGSAAAINDIFTIGTAVNAGTATLSFNPYVPTYTGVSQLDYSVTTGATSISTTGGGGPTSTISVTPGNLLIAIGYSQNAPSCSFADSLGNTWSPYSSAFAALNGNVGLAGFWSIVKYGGTDSFTLSGSGLCSAIYVTQFKIYSSSGTLISSAGTYVSSIGSGSNNATTGNIACGPNNALGFDFCFDPACTASPSQGSGGPSWNGQSAVWKTQQGGTISPAKPANALVTGTIPFTFSTNNPGDAVYTIGAAFSLQPILVGGPIPRLIYIMP